MKKWHKAALVVVGAVAFSSVAIQASDVLRNIDGNLLGLALETESPCGDGAVLVNLSSGALCVDQFEAAPSGECPVVSPANEVETQQNINEFSCAASSESERTPWRYVSLQQAQQLCARSGKSLPNNDEWYALVSSMGDPSICQTDSVAAAPTGSSGCETYAGVHDMIGNVWEWIDGEVQCDRANVSYAYCIIYAKSISSSKRKSAVTASITITTKSNADIPPPRRC